MATPTLFGLSLSRGQIDHMLCGHDAGLLLQGSTLFRGHPDGEVTIADTYAVYGPRSPSNHDETICAECEWRKANLSSYGLFQITDFLK